MSENESTPLFSLGLLPVYRRTTEHSSEEEREMDSRTLSAPTQLIQNPVFALPQQAYFNTGVVVTCPNHFSAMVDFTHHLMKKLECICE